MRFLSINGIRSNGEGNIDRLYSELNKLGHSGVDISYPRVSAFGARSRTRQRKNAEIILEHHQPGDWVIAHSYGCLLTLRAMEMGARFGRVWFFGAAMNDDFTFPRHGMTHLYNYHNQYDVALTLGKMLWWHDFGAMGQSGYKGAPDPRIQNKPFIDSSPGRFSLNHSHYFRSPNLVPLADHINKTARGAKP